MAYFAYPAYFLYFGIVILQCRRINLSLSIFHASHIVPTLIPDIKIHFEFLINLSYLAYFGKICTSDHILYMLHIVYVLHFIVNTVYCGFFLTRQEDYYLNITKICTILLNLSDLPSDTSSVDVHQILAPREVCNHMGIIHAYFTYFTYYIFDILNYYILCICCIFCIYCIFYIFYILSCLNMHDIVQPPGIEQGRFELRPDNVWHCKLLSSSSVESQTDSGIRQFDCAFISVLEEYNGSRMPGVLSNKTKKISTKAQVLFTSFYSQITTTSDILCIFDILCIILHIFM